MSEAEYNRAGRHLLASFALLAAAPGVAAAAPSLTPLYTFTGAPDGRGPQGVVFGTDGNLYGTTYSGGSFDAGYGGGTVFQLVPPGNGGTPWSENILVNYYGATQGKNCTHPIISGLGVAGFSPQSAPTFDPFGNLYAAASQSGCDEGTVVELTPAGSGFSIANVLQFQLGYPKRRDTRGNTPVDWGGMVYDSAGNVYGTTLGDGKFEAGEVFELGAGLPNNVVNLPISFKNNNKLGNGPQTGVVFGSGGVIYGTTSGTYDGGTDSTVFQRNTDGSTAVLHTFVAATGIGPGPILVSGGNIYGTAENGGTLQGGPGQGVVYELSPNGKKSTFTVLRTFGQGTDGAHPFFITFGTGGVIYGNTIDGGAHSVGMIFELTPPANKGGAWTETDLWDFTGAGPDGAQPIGNLALDAGGAIYGVTYSGGGGTANDGTVFKLVP